MKQTRRGAAARVRVASQCMAEAQGLSRARGLWCNQLAAASGTARHEAWTTARALVGKWLRWWTSGCAGGQVVTVVEGRTGVEEDRAGIRGAPRR